MAWLQIHQSLPTHRKTLMLSDALDISPAQAVGHLSCFWLWAIDNAPDGDLAGLSDKMIARAAQWMGDASLFTSSLASVRFLDGLSNIYTIHNWDKYTGRLIAKRETDNERMRRFRDASRDANGDAPVTRTFEVEKTRVEKTREYIHDQKSDDSAKSEISTAAPIGANLSNKFPRTKNDYSEDFAAFWEKYPRQVGKQEAQKAYHKARKLGVDARTLLAGASNYATSCQVKKTDPDYILHPSTFLNKKRWEDYSQPSTPVNPMDHPLVKRLYMTEAEAELAYPDYARNPERHPC